LGGWINIRNWKKGFYVGMQMKKRKKEKEERYDDLTI
jgi:hypothetical protein